MKVSKLILALFLGLLSSFSIASESIDRATRLVEQFMHDSGAPGLAVTVAYNNHIVWSEGFGYADIEQKVAVNPALTKFRVGSIAKPFTAFALAKLLEAEKIELDAEVQNYVPTFPQKNYPISIRQLAGHLSGIRHYLDDEMYQRKKYSSVKEGLVIFQDSPLTHKPNAQWTYTSYGFNLLSAAIEQAADTNYLEFMATEVFLPLGMQQTVADHLDEIIPHRSRYYFRRDNKFINEPEVDNSYKWASGGFLSTSEDLARFGLAHLNPQHLKKTTIDLLWTPQKTTAGISTKYGLGWRIFKGDEDQLWIGHGGGSIGGTTQFWLFPEHGLVIAAISNLTDLNYGTLIPELQKIFRQQASQP